MEPRSSSTEARLSSLELVSATAEETLALAARIAALLAPDDVVYLVGPLGAGKTVVAKGIVEALGLADARSVLSPSFTIMRSYGTDRAVHHLDFYRMRRPQDAAEIVAMAPRGILLIEWPERGEGFLPEPTWVVTLRMEDDTRHLTILGPADKIEALHQ